MDALKAMVAEKRKAIVEENGSSQRPTKYLRRGEIERLKEEAQAREEKERMDQDQKKAARQEAEDKKAAAAKPTLVSTSLLPPRAFCRSLSLR
jgi:pre-mRNA-splicing factor 18